MGEYKKYLASLALLLLSLPIITFSTRSAQRLNSRASEIDIAPTTVQINPGEITGTVSSIPIAISALAYDSSGQPILSGVNYEWGISSNNSILRLLPSDNIASAYLINEGVGNLWVRVSNQSGQATASIRVVVSPSVNPTPTPIVRPTNTPIPIITPTPTIATRWVKVTNPNGGETLYKGDTYRITWDSAPEIDMVYLGYSFGSGSLNWIATQLPNTGFYDWLVSIGNTTNTQVKIQVSGFDTGVGSTSDQSDNFFTVLVKPTATPTPIPSPTPTPTPLPIEIKPTLTDDTYLNFKSGKNSNGSSLVLETDGWPAVQNTYLQFQIPAGPTGKILSGKLRFKVKNSSATGQSIYISPQTNWTEASLTTSTAPNFSSQIGQITPVSLAGIYKEINLTNLPVYLSELGSHFTLVLGAPVSSFDALGIYSKESSTPPELILTIQP